MNHALAYRARQSDAALCREPFRRLVRRARLVAPRRIRSTCWPTAQGGHSVLLIAPTGAGKTLAGFLPSLIDLAERPKRKPGEAYRGIHTLYISPLKALAVDIERNLGKPVAEMGLPITIETRTGDTPRTSASARSLRRPTSCSRRRSSLRC